MSTANHHPCPTHQQLASGWSFRCYDRTLLQFPFVMPPLAPAPLPDTAEKGLGGSCKRNEVHQRKSQF